MDAISLKKVSKRFSVDGKAKSLFNSVKKLVFGISPKEILFVNKEIDFAISPGSWIGVVGANASGKTTLLRLISKIYIPTKGKIETKGKIVSLINLKSGLREELSMRDNVFFFGCLFGMTRKEVKDKFKDILGYSELGRFSETKIMHFSEGMKDRLILSLAFHTSFDILLLDEVFVASDKKFREKCINTIKNFVRKGKTILWVSHELDLVGRHCDKIIWIEGGIIKKIGGKEVLKEYGKKS